VVADSDAPLVTSEKAICEGVRYPEHVMSTLVRAVMSQHADSMHATPAEANTTTTTSCTYFVEYGRQTLNPLSNAFSQGDLGRDRDGGHCQPAPEPVALYIVTLTTTASSAEEADVGSVARTVASSPTAKRTLARPSRPCLTRSTARRDTRRRRTCR
jgi:hypothetical protein